jgi:solute carrier family 25 (mitochondrial phosphate transporter), member 23/24/25/41
VSLSAEDRPHHVIRQAGPSIIPSQPQPQPPVDHDTIDDDVNDFGEDDDEEDHHHWLGGVTALKFLLAGGLAGAGTYMPAPCVI